MAPTAPMPVAWRSRAHRAASSYIHRESALTVVGLSTATMLRLGYLLHSNSEVFLAPTRPGRQTAQSSEAIVQTIQTRLLRPVDHSRHSVTTICRPGKIRQDTKYEVQGCVFAEQDCGEEHFVVGSVSGSRNHDAERCGLNVRCNSKHAAWSDPPEAAALP